MAITSDIAGRLPFSPAASANSVQTETNGRAMSVPSPRFFQLSSKDETRSFSRPAAKDRQAVLGEITSKETIAGQPSYRKDVFQIPVSTMTKSVPAITVSNRNPMHKLPVLDAGQIAGATRKMLDERLRLIACQLAHFDRTSPGCLKIFAGCEGFLNAEDIAANAYLDPATFYEWLSTNMTALSAAFPNIVLCPGTAYISTAIPAPHEDTGLQFDQDGERRALRKTCCYSTNLMPVLHGGKIVALIRKGERITLQEPTCRKKNPVKSRSLATIQELGVLSVERCRLIVQSYHEDSLTDVTDGAGKRSTCYLGKTLLPGEEELLKKYILTDPNDSIERLSSHRQQIAGFDFVFVVCAEFRLPDRHGSNQSSVGQILENSPEGSVDFLIHSSVGGDITPHMQRCAQMYIHSDFGLANKIIAPLDGHTREAQVDDRPEARIKTFFYP